MKLSERSLLSGENMSGRQILLTFMTMKITFQYESIAKQFGGIAHKLAGGDSPNASHEKLLKRRSSSGLICSSDC
jgi:hypothetical protein